MNTQQMAPAKVLFAISDTGAGHRSAAVAISAALQDVGGGRVSSDIIDVLRICNVPLVRNSPDLYDRLSTTWLPLYNAAFRLTNGKRPVELISRFVNLQARYGLVRAFHAAQPQVVVIAHPLPQRLIAATQRIYRLPFRIVTVVTDLVSLHYSWTYPGIDLCMVPTDEAYDLMRQRGMPPQVLVRTGFPVHPKFVRKQLSQEAARGDLRLEHDRFTILVTSGGVGAGNVQELVLTLEQRFPDYQLLVVTAKNQALFQELQTRRRSPHTHIYGFVHNMEELMAASDIVVTKAGPGTLMEALVMRRPVIVTEAVGMQEWGNIDFVLDHGLGCFCPTTERIVQAVEDLTNPQRYAETVERLADAVPRDGSIQIANILLEQLSLAPTPPTHTQWRKLPLRRSKQKT